jgi:hypothetical protein
MYAGEFRAAGVVIFEHACNCKRSPGPSKTWIKVKNKAHPAMLRVKEAFELEKQRSRK